MDDVQARIKEVERRLADLKARLPAHSVPPAMIIEMEDLEEELAALRERRDAQPGKN